MFYKIIGAPYYKFSHKICYSTQAGVSPNVDYLLKVYNFNETKLCIYLFIYLFISR